jgi:hypothetical protein
MAIKTVKGSTMTRPNVSFHDVATGEDTTREMNDIEYAEWQALIEAGEAEKAALADKEIARAALLDRLGITADEAKLLAG